MKKYLKKTLIVITAVICAFSIHITVGALNFNDTEVSIDDIWDFIQSVITTSPDENNTTTTTETTTASGTTTTDPVNNQGVRTITTTTDNYTTVADGNNGGGNNYGGNGGNSSSGGLNVNPGTTEMPVTEEDSSTSFESSLGELLENDTAAVIIQPNTTEVYTLGGSLVVNNGSGDDDFTWQKAALIAAAVLLAVLVALFVALLVQRSRRYEHKGTGVRYDDTDKPKTDENNGPVPVEIMTKERIAELLGASVKKGENGYEISGRDSAAAIKNAVLLDQLKNSYSDPLIRKYTEDPVVFSPQAGLNLDENSVTGAEVLSATNALLEDITADEKYAADTRGISMNLDEIDKAVSSEGTRECPECHKPVGGTDVFCHSCGAYVG